jgi:hypothetical protein
LPAYGHDVGERFAIGPVGVQVTPADHAWQNESAGASDRIFQPEDCCGFGSTHQMAPSGHRAIRG